MATSHGTFTFSSRGWACIGGGEIVTHAGIGLEKEVTRTKA